MKYAKILKYKLSIFGAYMKTNSVKRKMMNAIVSLLGKKQYLQITVTDLIKEAGIARVSFYRTYNSVD